MKKRQKKFLASNLIMRHRVSAFKEAGVEFEWSIFDMSTGFPVMAFHTGDMRVMEDWCSCYVKRRFRRKFSFFAVSFRCSSRHEKDESSLLFAFSETDAQNFVNQEKATILFGMLHAYGVVD